MKSLIMAAIVSLMMMGCARPLASPVGLTPQSIQMATDPMPVITVATTTITDRTAIKKALCDKAAQTTKDVDAGMRKTYKNSAATLGACEAGLEMGYFIVAFESVENDMLIRKIDVIYLAIFVMGEWHIADHDLILMEGEGLGDDSPAVPGSTDTFQEMPGVMTL